MSSHSYFIDCPECGDGEFNVNETTKPYPIINGFCLECGFGFNTQDYQMDLEEVNQMRSDWDLPILKKLKGDK